MARLPAVDSAIEVGALGDEAVATSQESGLPSDTWTGWLGLAETLRAGMTTDPSSPTLTCTEAGDTLTAGTVAVGLTTRVISRTSGGSAAARGDAAALLRVMALGAAHVLLTCVMVTCVRYVPMGRLLVWALTPTTVWLGEF